VNVQKEQKHQDRNAMNTPQTSATSINTHEAIGQTRFRSAVAALASFVGQGLKEAREARRTLKEEGFKALWRKYGWKLFAVVFVYYLIRDLILYVFIPWYLYGKIAG
jgi:hypothetical protein